MNNLTNIDRVIFLLVFLLFVLLMLPIRASACRKATVTNSSVISVKAMQSIDLWCFRDAIERKHWE